MQFAGTLMYLENIIQNIIQEPVVPHSVSLMVCVNTVPQKEKL